MSDLLGAAPYTPPPAPSLWERLATWWRDRGTMSAEELQARIAADVNPEDVDRFLPPALRKPHAYAPPPAKNGPRFPLVGVFE